MEKQKMAVALVVFLCFLVLATSPAQAGRPALQDPKIIQPFPLILKTFSGDSDPRFDCLSWRLAVETNNIRNWITVPEECGIYIAEYMTRKQYSHDCEAVADAAIKYAESLRIPRDGRSIWVFDVDETALSNLPYFATPEIAFGVKPINATTFFEYLLEGKAPALPAILRLYRAILRLGIKAVFLTGATEIVREARTQNLKEVGYHTWEKLILKPASEVGTSAIVYKSQERDKLVAAGYRIVGNIGDQWTDILGSNAGGRTFKVPNPMYYVP